jgi:hypothetical protein
LRQAIAGSEVTRIAMAKERQRFDAQARERAKKGLPPVG